MSHNLSRYKCEKCSKLFLDVRHECGYTWCRSCKGLSLLFKEEELNNIDYAQIMNKHYDQDPGRAEAEQEAAECRREQEREQEREQDRERDRQEEERERCCEEERNYCNHMGPG